MPLLSSHEQKEYSHYRGSRSGKNDFDLKDGRDSQAFSPLKGSEWIEEIKKMAFCVNRRGRGGGHQDFREDPVPFLQIDSFPSQGHIHNPNTPESSLLSVRQSDKGSQSS
jgi:hypothetical protein